MTDPRRSTSPDRSDSVRTRPLPAPTPTSRHNDDIAASAEKRSERPCRYWRLETAAPTLRRPRLGLTPSAYGLPVPRTRLVLARWYHRDLYLIMWEERWQRGDGLRRPQRLWTAAAMIGVHHAMCGARRGQNWNCHCSAAMCHGERHSMEGVTQ